MEPHVVAARPPAVSFSGPLRNTHLAQHQGSQLRRSATSDMPQSNIRRRTSSHSIELYAGGEPVMIVAGAVLCGTVWYWWYWEVTSDSPLTFIAMPHATLCCTDCDDAVATEVAKTLSTRHHVTRLELKGGITRAPDPQKADNGAVCVAAKQQWTPAQHSRARTCTRTCTATPMTDAGAHELAQQLSACTALTKLDISCTLELESLQQRSTALISHIQHTDNNISDEGMGELLVALGACTKLQHLAFKGDAPPAPRRPPCPNINTNHQPTSAPPRRVKAWRRCCPH